MDEEESEKSRPGAGDINDLEMDVDGQKKKFGDWTRDFVQTHYPHVGQRRYRVPALHFNQQALVRHPSGLGHELRTPQETVWRGDEAHASVLDKLEALGHYFHASQGTPFFIISAYHFDNYLYHYRHRPPEEKKRKEKNRKKRSKPNPTVCSDSQVQDCTLGDDRSEANNGSEKDETDATGVCQMPKCTAAADDQSHTPSSTTEPYQQQQQAPIPDRRTEVDIVVLSEKWGVTLIEVKSTDEERGGDVLISMKKAVGQLQRQRDVFQHVMPDIRLLPITLVVALPNVHISEERLKQIRTHLSLDDEVKVMCKDQLCEATSNSQPSTLSQWWVCSHAADDTKHMDVTDIKTVVGRLCGVLSIVEVWTQTKPRMEVRTVGEAISLAAQRMSDIVLLPEQFQLLADPHKTHVCISGPLGSGKTLALQLKGREWVGEGRRVVLLNVRRSGRGRPAGHVLHKAIEECRDKSSPGTVERHDLALNETSLDAIVEMFSEDRSTNKLCFLLDELTQKTFCLAKRLRAEFPTAPIWCVAVNVFEPEGFCTVRFGQCLRNPPTVQRLMKELDLNPFNRKAYCTHSAPHGLSSDGYPIVFIQHKDHGTDCQPINCDVCVQQLVEFLLDPDKLGLSRLPKPRQAESEVEQEETSGAGKPKPELVSSKPTSLRFQDVMILHSFPADMYKPGRDGSFKTPIPDLLTFFQALNESKLLSTLEQRAIPLQINLNDVLPNIAFPSGDKITFANVEAVPSLEKKVVIFWPGASPIHNTGSSLRQMVIRQSVKWFLDTNMRGNAVFDRIVWRFATGSYGRLLRLAGISSTEELRKNFQGVKVKELGNLLDGRRYSDHLVSSSDADHARVLRAIRGDAPHIHQAYQQALRNQGSTPKLATSDHGDCCCGHKDEDEKGDEDVDAPVHADEMASLSEHDKDGLLLAASRCLGQLVVVLP